ncbi:transcription-repair coupling factor [Ehrlichia ruminantium]|nr:transcription-repair coupling factor [Ehrlichia ruminantium]GAT75647.1 transcription-repair coupling factor [Ehrlichia ruminantium]
MNTVNYIPNIPHTLEAFAIAEMYNKGLINSAIYITNQEDSLYQLSSIFQFYIPNLKIIVVPAWNLIPYKKNSPNNLIMAERIKSLYSLTHTHNNTTTPYIIITTTNAVIQKVLPRNIISQIVFKITAQENLPIHYIKNYLITHGYTQYSTIQDIGEFCVNNNTIDIFPITYPNPIRIYLNNDHVESIKTFDCKTQLIHTDSSINEIFIYPTSEIIKQQKNIEQFLKIYKTKANQDKHLLNTIVSKKKYIGEENFLPLFYEEELENIFNYIQDIQLIFSNKIIDQISQYNNKLRSNYKNSLYYQVAPDQLYITLENFYSITKQLKKIIFLTVDELNDVNIDIQNPQCNVTKIKKIPNFKALAVQEQTDVFEIFAQYIKNQHHTYKLLIACHSVETLEYIQSKFATCQIKLNKINNYHEINKTYNIAILQINNSFSTESTIIVTEDDLLGTMPTTSISDIISYTIDLNIGDIVIHKDYGIGKIAKLETIKVLDNYHDFLKIEYYNNDKLFLPVENINLITRYSNQDSNTTLDRLGSTSWQQRKTKLKNHIQKIAKELIKIEAARQLMQGTPFLPNNTYKNFCDEFAYTETIDQLQAIQDIENDLSSGKIMNRLICGDAGFGKTEVALRAAFLVAIKNYQVAVIVPTTLLCKQHFAVFTERFKNFPNIKIQQLSKIVNKHEIKKIKENISCGHTHIIIGTHAILSQDVNFFNLSLVIIDEEQQFGVKQKELLKKIKANVHVLSLSATPIPRTLHMSLCGIKNFSLIKTPPKNRLPVITYTIHYTDNTIKNAIIHEYERGGRTFYVCPQINNIKNINDNLIRLLPDIKIGIVHGQLPSHELENIMNDFLDGKFTVLLTTSIIECGLDIPHANTIIIHNADMFGLAQLYQLKGRVGRSNIKGYAYFILSDNINNISERRLEIIRSIDSINSGFALSLHDMDIRGFGNLIGEEQSGNIKDIGIELYQQMLEEELNTNNQCYKNLHHININININIRIPEHYISDIGLRMNMYKRIGNLRTKEEIDSFHIALIKKFGKLPDEVENLLDIIYIKQLCIPIGIYEIEQVKNIVNFKIHNNVTFPKMVLDYLIHNPLILKIQNNSISMLVNNISSRITKLIIHHLKKITSLL